MIRSNRIFVLLLPCALLCGAFFASPDRALGEVSLADGVKEAPTEVRAYVQRKIIERAAKEDASTKSALAGLIWKSLSGDLDGDGTPDLVVGYSIEGIGGGNSYESALAVFFMKDGRYVFGAETPLGSKVTIQDVGLYTPIEVRRGAVISRHITIFGETWPNDNATHVIRFANGAFTGAIPTSGK